MTNVSSPSAWQQRWPLLSAIMGVALMATGSSAIAEGKVAGQPEVSVEGGRVAGTSLAGGVRLFAGIPYAAAPTGARRWQPPSMPSAWRGVRDASRFGPTCPQLSMGWNERDVARMGEDCLNLNIWAPAGAGKKLPVMIWIHGGGFLGGSGSSATYNGAALASKGVIVVTFNYRLGVLGFLAHPELTAASGNGTSGNYAVQDQIAALEWVKRNVSRFGGDPANVTVFGQSAGAMSTSILATMPQARGLMRRVILQSGTPFSIGPLQSRAEAERDGLALGRLDDLRRKSSKEVIDLWTAYSSAAPATRRAIPILDGKVIRTQPSEVFARGGIRDLPMLVGSVVQEIPPAGSADLEQSLSRTLGTGAAEVLADYRRRGDDAEAGDVGMQLMTDMMFRCGSILAARESAHSWLFHFYEPFPGRGRPAHSAEVFYVFDTPADARAGGPFDSAQMKLSSTMRDYWTNFAKKGDPNGAGLPAWPTYDPGERLVELRAFGVRSTAGLRKEQCKPFLDRWEQQFGRRGGQ